MLNFGRDENGRSCAHHFSVTFQLHQTFSFNHVINLFFLVVFVFRNKSFGLVCRESKIKIFRRGVGGSYQHLGQSAVEVSRQIFPHNLDCLANYCSVNFFLVLRFLVHLLPIYSRCTFRTCHFEGMVFQTPVLCEELVATSKCLSQVGVSLHLHAHPTGRVCSH